MRTRVLALASGFALAAPAFAQQTWKHEKYQLPNGMTVILHEDHTLPIATVNIWYRVGGKEERPGRSGFAHLFEHLMFMGTRRVPGNQFDVLMETAGGANNASTSYDRTNYFSAGPSHILPTLLWLDADRLEDLARTMTQDKLDKQRAVVRNERRQTSENRPYGKADLLLTETMFPKPHPYFGAVIGSHADLEAASVVDVQEFFANYYVPNNASLVVAGDFDALAIKSLIADLFGSIPRSPEPERITSPTPSLGRVVRLTTVDQVQLPRVTMAYHAPGQYAAGSAEIDLLGALLAEGKSSRLYNRLVMQDQTVAEVSAGVIDGGQLAQVFGIHAYLKPGSSHDDVEQAIDEEVARLLESGPTPDELDRHKALIERRMLTSVQSVDARADKLNEYEYFFGNPDSFARDLDRYRSATPAAITDWGRRIVTQDSRFVLRVLPAEPDAVASARDTRPADAPVSGFSVTSPESFTLSNGMNVQLWSRPGLPLVAISAIIRPGITLEEPATSGLASLTMDMLDEGAAGRDALAFADSVQMLGGSFSTDATHTSASVSISALSRHLDPACGLLADALRRANLADADFARVRALRLEELRAEQDEPTTVASRVAMRKLFGDAHTYARPAVGTTGSVQSFTLSDVKAAYATLLRPEFVTLLVAGDVTPEQARAAIEKSFADWRGSGSVRLENLTAGVPSSDSLRLFIVDRPNAVQTVIRYAMPSDAFNSPRRVELRLLSTILGGTFTSRLNANLREDKGYTYGARSSVTLEPEVGYVSAGASVRADATGESLREFAAEFARLRAGDITDADAAKARESLRQNAVESFEGLEGLLAMAGEMIRNAVPFETIGRDMQVMGTVNAPALNALAKDAFPIERGVLVLVGDKALILEEIKDLGLPAPTVVDAEGN